MLSINMFIVVKSFLLFAFAFWLLIAIFNNVTDFGTNSFLLKKMLSLEELSKDNNLGKGLLWRRILNKQVPTFLLRLIIFYQIITSLLLWISGAKLLLVVIENYSIMQYKYAIAFSNFSLMCFSSLWFFFFIGGLWFGYWLKMPKVQQVHLSLLMISMALFIIVNMNVAA